MQQQTINFAATVVRRTVSLRERMNEMDKVIDKWLDTKSEFYSRIAGFSITRRIAIRIGIMIPVMLVVAVLAMGQAPVECMVSAIISGWAVYRLNKADNGSAKKKGGRK